MKKISVIMMVALFPLMVLSQGVKISSTTGSPDASSILEIESTTQGILPPRMTTSQRMAIVNPAEGLQVYNTDTDCMEYYTGSFWRQVCGASSCSGAPATPGTISGDALVCAGTTGSYFTGEVAEATSYTWSYTGTGASFSGNYNTVVISFSNSATSGNLSVTAVNACGSSSASSNYPVTIATAPVSSFTPSTTTPSWNQSVAFTPTSATNETYLWTFPDGSTSSSTNPTYTWNMVGTGSVNLSVTRNGCASTTTTNIGAAAASSGNQAFTYTGTPSIFVVPSGVSTVSVDVLGAQAYCCAGGLGGQVTGSLSVTAGQYLYLYVGGNGGYNGGGNGGFNGGGASDIRIGGTAIGDRVCVAGGGGGPGGNGTNIYGGSGGGTNGGSGQSSGSGGGGGGASQSSAGSGGSGTTPGTAGSFGIGGNGGGGGGGGGYYGGGGGGNHSSFGPSAGGGGSSWTGSLTGASTNSGVRSGNGQITLTW